MIRTKEEQIFINNQFIQNYETIGKQYLCKNCNTIIKTKKIKHFELCTGLLVRVPIEKEINKSPELVTNIVSKLCDLGCGQVSQFVHKNGKAYCCQFGNACPVKKKNDSEAKKGINPFEGIDHPRGMLGVPSWNKGLTKETSDIVRKSRIAYSKTYALTGHLRKKFQHTPESKAKLSAAAFRRRIGGYKIGAGKGKRGWYKGFFCDSSWELAYVIYCVEHHIDIKRNTEKFPYKWKGKDKNYIPDFIVEGSLVEVKGYASPEWFAKLKANPNVKVYYQNDMKDIFKYVKEKYGKDFIKLYEKPKEGSKF